MMIHPGHFMRLSVANTVDVEVGTLGPVHRSRRRASASRGTLLMYRRPVWAFSIAQGDGHQGKEVGRGLRRDEGAGQKSDETDGDGESAPNPRAPVLGNPRIRGPRGPVFSRHPGSLLKWPRMGDVFGVKKRRAAAGQALAVRVAAHPHSLRAMNAATYAFKVQDDEI